MGRVVVLVLAVAEVFAALSPSSNT